MCTSCSCSGLLGLSRREVLGGLGAMTIAGLAGQLRAVEGGVAPKDENPEKWPVVYGAYLRPRGEYWLGWPGTAWDPKGFVEKSKALVEGFAKELKVRVVFEAEPLYDDGAVSKFVEKVKGEKPAGVLLFPLHLYHWNGVEKASQTGVPTIIFAPLGTCFTGHIQALSKKPGIYLASSADFELKPVKMGLKMVRANHDIRHTRIAVVAGDASKDVTLEPLGLGLRYMPRSTFTDALSTIGESPEVAAMVEAYSKGAQRIVEPTRQDLVNAAKNYYAALKILQEKGCDGITMDCLGLVTERKIPCPPCMAWAKLLDVGKLGVCEADINAVLSQALCCNLLGRAGFQQDPVPETVNNTFIGAHCVCPTRLDGFDQPAAPYVLRSHSESNLGVSFQVIWPAEKEVTVMQMMGAGRMILGKGRTIRNFDTPPAGGCRTSVELALEAPADTRDTKGFHQLFILGDHRHALRAYAQVYGIAVESI